MSAPAVAAPVTIRLKRVNHGVERAARYIVKQQAGDTPLKISARAQRVLVSLATFFLRRQAKRATALRCRSKERTLMTRASLHAARMEIPNEEIARLAIAHAVHVSVSDTKSRARPAKK